MSEEIKTLTDNYEAARVKRMAFHAGMGRTVLNGKVIINGPMYMQKTAKQSEELEKLEAFALQKLTKAIRKDF